MATTTLGIAGSDLLAQMTPILPKVLNDLLPILAVLAGVMFAFLVLDVIVGMLKRRKNSAADTQAVEAESENDDDEDEDDDE